jgi:hypothetical protein
MPAWGGAAGPFEGAERAFQERTDLAEPAQGGLAAGGVPIAGHGVTFHIGSIKAYLIRQAKNAVRRIKNGGETGKTLKTQKTTSDGRNLPGYSTRRISNSERLPFFRTLGGTEDRTFGRSRYLDNHPEPGFLGGNGTWTGRWKPSGFLRGFQVR